LDETNTTIQLELSDDWIQFTFDQPMDADPGAKWVYNSGSSHLMSGIIKKVSGQFLDEFAEEHVFGPLGIREYHWKKTAKGHPDGLGGLYLEAEDLARIGYLYLRGGVWNGRRILSESWVQNATDKWVENVNREGFGYGFQWWRLDRDNSVIWAGLGFGGQYLLVLPELDLVAVINSWNLYGRPERRILNDFLDGLIGSVR
ncbi:MAG: class C beta-lactamase-related serine hydrolase, partial [Bacteroidetes bacterium]